MTAAAHFVTSGTERGKTNGLVQNLTFAQERRIVGLCRRSKHPAYHAVAYRFGLNRYDKASSLCTSVSLLHREAMRKRQDGWLTRAQALKVCAAGGHMRTARRHLDDLLTVSEHFGERAEDELVYLRSMFLGEAKRAATLAQWERELDAKALATRAARGTSCPKPVLRRAKFGPPPLPTDHSTEVADPVEPLLEPITEGNRTGYITSDPRAAVGANVSGAGDKSPQGRDEVDSDPFPGLDAPVAEQRAWAARDNARAEAEAWQRARTKEPPKPPPKPKVARADCGTPILYLKLNYRPEQVAYEGFSEELQLQACAKVLDRYGEGDYGGYVTNAARKIKQGVWRAPC